MSLIIYLFSVILISAAGCHALRVPENCGMDEDSFTIQNMQTPDDPYSLEFMAGVKSTTMYTLKMLLPTPTPFTVYMTFPNAPEKDLSIPGQAFHPTFSKAGCYETGFSFKEIVRFLCTDASPDRTTKKVQFDVEVTRNPLAKRLDDFSIKFDFNGSYPSCEIKNNVVNQCEPEVRGDFEIAQPRPWKSESALVCLKEPLTVTNATAVCNFNQTWTLPDDIKCTKYEPEIVTTPICAFCVGKPSGSCKQELRTAKYTIVAPYNATLSKRMIGVNETIEHRIMDSSLYTVTNTAGNNWTFAFNMPTVGEEDIGVYDLEFFVVKDPDWKTKTSFEIMKCDCPEPPTTPAIVTTTIPQPQCGMSPGLAGFIGALVTVAAIATTSYIYIKFGRRTNMRKRNTRPEVNKEEVVTLSTKPVWAINQNRIENVAEEKSQLQAFYQNR